MPLEPKTHHDLRNADPPCEVGQLLGQLAGRADDWEVVIHLCGQDDVFILNFDVEDVHFEQGRAIITTGSDTSFTYTADDPDETAQRIEDKS